MDGNYKRTLQTLPIELLYEIQSFALSSTLPHVSKHFYAVFKSAPSSVHAQYLIGRYFERAERSTSVRALGLFSQVLRYPLCTQPVLEAILRVPGRPELTYTPEKVPHIDLPRRLFRTLSPQRGAARQGKAQRASKLSPEAWTEDDAPLPLLRFLYDHPRIPPPSPGTYDGYALTRAVHAGFVQLVRFMLDHGADPGHTDGMAVMVAIKRGDLGLVRMLVERADSEDRGKRKKKKRRKLEDRVEVTPGMLRQAVKCDARDIVDYFMKEKGCVPDMQTLTMMST